MRFLLVLLALIGWTAVGPALAGGGPGDTGGGNAHPFKVRFELPRSVPPGNVAVAPDGRVFISLHHFYGPKHRLAEIKPDGSVAPFTAADGLNPILGIQIDRDGILWALEGVGANSQHGHGVHGHVRGWNIENGEVHKVFKLFAPAIAENSFLNDLAVDSEHQTIFITDTAGPENAALIVLDMKTGEARRVLEGSSFTVPENEAMVIDGRTVTLGGAPARIGANPVTVDAAGQWVYFAPMTGRSVYRARTGDLRNPTLSEEALRGRVERYGDKPISDGITVDRSGNVYITAITENAVGVTRPDGSYEELFRDDGRLSWPDGFAVGPKDTIYLTVNQLHRSPVLNGGADDSRGNFSIVTFRALAPAVPGR